MAATKASSKASSAKKADHPKYADMIKTAIVVLKDRKGSSRQAIKKYILGNFKVADEAVVTRQVNMALKRGADSG
ncbi:hypothetical protein H4R34_005477, partial [Dimargaris verticillata]